MRTRIAYGAVIVAIAAAGSVPLLGNDSPAAVREVSTQPVSATIADQAWAARHAADRVRTQRIARAEARRVAAARRAAQARRIAAAQRKAALQRRAEAALRASRSRPRSPQHRPSADGLNWGALAQCESGGNPRAIGGGGRYRGLYQFMTSTWRSVGGVGDPINASPGEQTYRAQILYRRSGAGQWPVCGRRLFS